MTDNEVLPLTIDEGMPSSRNEWPEGVLQNLSKFSQGDVVANPPFFYFADPKVGVWAWTAQFADDDEGEGVIEAGLRCSPQFGMVVSQTCDVVEEDASRPKYAWVQICPVYKRDDLSEVDRNLLKKSKGAKYLLHIPTLVDGFWVADLRVEFPVEKGWLSDQPVIAGCNDDVQRRRVAERLAAVRARPAFGRSFVRAVQGPLVDELKQLKRKKKSFWGKLCDQVDEVAVRMDDLLEPKSVQVVLIVSKDLDQDILEWWQEWWDRAAVRAREHDLELMQLEVALDAKLPLAEYRRMVQVPLERVS